MFGSPNNIDLIGCLYYFVFSSTYNWTWYYIVGHTARNHLTKDYKKILHLTSDTKGDILMTCT